MTKRVFQFILLTTNLLLHCTRGFPILRATSTKKCDAPRTNYANLTTEILSRLQDLETAVRSLDDGPEEDEDVMNIYFEQEPTTKKIGQKLSSRRNETTESEVNRGANVARYLFSGDIRRRKSSVRGVKASTLSTGGGDDGDEDVLQDAITENVNLWPNATVPYTFNCSFNAEGKVAVKVAMDDISRKTCIRFVKRESEPDWVEFFHGRGCWSFAGNQKVGMQKLSLQKDGCTHKGIAIHEIMHTLGYEHEHNRPDRDEFIKIVWKNIGKKDKVQFHILQNDSFSGKKYDYGSIMHYSENEFSKDLSKDTIVPKEEGVIVGQRRGMSDIDAQSMNKIYCNCNETDYTMCIKDKDVDLRRRGMPMKIH